MKKCFIALVLTEVKEFKKVNKADKYQIKCNSIKIHCQLLNNVIMSSISIPLLGLKGTIKIGSLFNATEKVKEILQIWSMNLRTEDNLPFDEVHVTDPAGTQDADNAAKQRGMDG